MPRQGAESEKEKMDEINFLKYFFEENAISAIAESIKRVKDSFDLDESKESIRELFSLVAHLWYIKNTRKSWEELNDSGYLSYDVYSWSNGLTGDEWKKDDIINIIQSAILEADFYLSQEN